MILGQVRGRVVSTAKIDNFDGKKLLIVGRIRARTRPRANRARDGLRRCCAGREGGWCSW